ncbi:hypothetical protein RRG08_059744 [Elysia crispata]|uniref:Uncharacterized protein n=1 Tax=Elysia crispata TaxID=231223 RepID=A0AAE1D2K1_9GAST|nr:hypothetical protein RRG08_059744 [Elysia crispata]
MAPLLYELTSQFLQDKGSRSESVSDSVDKGYLDEIINSIKSHYMYILGMAGFVVLSEISQRVGQDGIDRCALNR